MHNPYTNEHPLTAQIDKRYLLTAEESSRCTYHIDLMWKGDFPYEVGDCIGIFCENDPKEVQKLLDTLDFSGKEPVINHKRGQKETIRDFLKRSGNITGMSPKFFQEIEERAGREEMPRKEMKEYLAERHVRDVFAEMKPSFSPQEIADRLKPVIPRLYSIASSYLHDPKRIGLTVGLYEFDVVEGKRLGVCTNYLCHMVDEHDPSIHIYHHPHRGFTLPQDQNAPMIMVGPGTGIAPYRGFMQERIKRRDAGKNWLFFGERNRATDFYYREYWEELVQRGALRLDTAFSRDQEQKIYVQDRLKEHADEVRRWLNEGAYFYVCGDAKRMAKDVDSVLQELMGKEGVAQLKKEGRYLRDVY